MMGLENHMMTSQTRTSFRCIFTCVLSFAWCIGTCLGPRHDMLRDPQDIKNAENELGEKKMKREKQKVEWERKTET